MSLYCGKENRLLICDYLRIFLFNHCFISYSVSLILYFSFWQVDQEAVAKSSIVCGTLATLGSMAMRESSLATLVTFLPRLQQPEVPQLLVTMYASLWFHSQNVTVTSLQVASCYRCWHRFSNIMQPVLIFSIIC